MAREIDDVSKRKLYKDSVYGNKKSTIDDYTGKRVFRGNEQDAVKRHGTHMTSDTDHITPIDVVEKRYLKLSKEQQKRLVNNEAHNYATVNSKLNRSKGNLENHEYLIRQIKKGEPEDLRTTARMLGYEADSRVHMRAEAAGMSVDNQMEKINQATDQFMQRDFVKNNAAGLNAAAQAAVFAGTMSVLRNTCEVMKGNKDGSEATEEVLKDVASSAAAGYITGTLAKSSLAGGAGILAAGAVQISKQVIACSKGELNEAQLMRSVAETSAGMIGGYIGSAMGAMVGAALLPGIGGLAGEALGRQIGIVVGEVVTTTICGELINTIQYARDYEKHNEKMISLYRRAEREIQDSQARLESIINKENRELQASVEEGFAWMLEGVRNNSYEQVTKGLARLGSRFGITEEELFKDRISRRDLFSQKDEVIVIS